MNTLVANTATLLISSAPVDRCVVVFIDGTTVVRLSLAKADFDTATEGFGCLGYANIYIPAGQKLYVISTGTPNVSWAEVHNGTNIYNLM